MGILALLLIHCTLVAAFPADLSPGLPREIQYGLTLIERDITPTSNGRL